MNQAQGGSAGLVDALRQLLGPAGVLTEPADVAPYCRDWRGLYAGRTPAVARPADTAGLAAIIRLCAERGIPVVPQGGNTSMVGGATPSPAGDALIVSLSRLNRLRAIDPVDLTMTVEAGMTLKAAQDAAREAGCLLPLSITSEGSAQIGGVLATNAGGNNTVRYGNARDLVLGLEVVLPDGRVWNGLRALRKDNTGYCLRHLFVGAEGTLGIITAAVLKLAPQPREREVALAAIPTPEAALALLSIMQEENAAALLAFEYMGETGMDLVLRHVPGTALPFAAPSPGYALIELAGSGLRDGLEAALTRALEEGVATDAVIAESEAQRRALWRLREEHSEAQNREGRPVRNDVSVPVSRTATLIRRGAAAVDAVVPGTRIVAFGHIGDGNIHFNLLPPEGGDAAAFQARSGDLMDAVNGVVRDLGGSFSAEHGIGQLKPAMLADWRGGVELDLMRALKQAIDPRGIMNPGKVLG